MQYLPVWFWCCCSPISTSSSSRLEVLRSCAVSSQKKSSHSQCTNLSNPVFSTSFHTNWTNSCRYVLTRSLNRGFEGSSVAPVTKETGGWVGPSCTAAARGRTSSFDPHKTRCSCLPPQLIVLFCLLPDCIFRGFGKPNHTHSTAVMCSQQM